MTEKTKVQTVLEAMEVLKSNKDILDSLIADGVFKAGSGTSMRDEMMPDVKDRWDANGGHGRMSREEVKTGPSTGASGAYNEQMNRDYSNNAKQRGTTAEYESFADLLGGLGKAVKSLAETQVKSNEMMSSALALLSAKAEPTKAAVKAEDEKEEKKEDKEEMDMEKALTAGRGHLAKAKSFLRDAAEKAEQAEETSSVSKAERLNSEAVALKGRAKAEIMKANAYALEGVTDPDFLKSLSVIAAKADVAVSKAEDEKEEKDEKKEMDKAKGHDAAGNQADKQDPKTGNQDDASVKAISELSDRVAKAVDGFQMLQTDVKGLMTALGSRKIPPAFSLAKGAGDPPVPVAIIKGRVDGLKASGSLNETEEFHVDQIMAYIDAKTDPTLAMHLIRRAPDKIKEIFKELDQAA